MTKAFSTYSLLFAALLCSFYIFVSEAQVTCQSNGCDECCVASESCSSKHTVMSESHHCRHQRSLPPRLDTPEIPGVMTLCPYDVHILRYGECEGSRVTDRAESVGDYGKPNLVGAEFQSVDFDAFSMTVKWEHTDAEILSSFSNLSSVRGYEIRIYEKKPGQSESVLLCFCVTDPSVRNISDIHSTVFQYNELWQMIVEVRAFPSLSGRDESNTRRNCSLLTGCSTTESCLDNCYSWPQNCLNFLPSYNPLLCTPPLYSRPMIVKAEMRLVNESDPDSDAGKLDLSWKPPEMDYDLFPVPDTYYVIIENGDITFNWMVVNSTDISVLSLNYTATCVVFITAYVPCSGLSQNAQSTGDAGCGNYERKDPDIILPPPPTTTAFTQTTMPGTVRTREPTAIAVAISAAVILICVFITLITAFILWRRNEHKTKSNISNICIRNEILPLPKPSPKVRVFVFYPKDTEREDETTIQTYLVAPLSEYDAIKEVKSSDDPYFERGHIPESIDKGFREADFVVIVCNSLFLSEWNCDKCSPSVQLLKRYMGNVSIRSDDSISKLITVILDEQKKELLSHSRLNLGSLRNFIVTESTWEREVENIVEYMTGTPHFQITCTTQDGSFDMLESPGTPVSDIVPDSSQESHTVTPRTSDSSLSDTKDHHDIVYMQDGEAV